MFDRPLYSSNRSACGSRALGTGPAPSSPSLTQPLLGGPRWSPDRALAWPGRSRWRTGDSRHSRRFQRVRLAGSLAREGLIEHLERALGLAGAGALARHGNGLSRGGRPFTALRAQVAQAAARGSQAISLGVAQSLEERLVLLGNARRAGARVRLGPRPLFPSLLARSHTSPFSRPCGGLVSATSPQRARRVRALAEEACLVLDSIGRSLSRLYDFGGPFSVPSQGASISGPWIRSGACSVRRPRALPPRARAQRSGRSRRVA